MTDAEQISGRVGNAISEALRDSDEMVTRWVAIVETLDGDGARALWTLGSEGLKAWDTLGLLAYGMQVEQTASLKAEDD